VRWKQGKILLQTRTFVCTLTFGHGVIWSNKKETFKRKWWKKRCFWHNREKRRKTEKKDPENQIPWETIESPPMLMLMLKMPSVHSMLLVLGWRHLFITTYYSLWFLAKSEEKSRCLIVYENEPFPFLFIFYKKKKYQKPTYTSCCWDICKPHPQLPGFGTDYVIVEVRYVVAYYKFVTFFFFTDFPQSFLIRKNSVLVLVKKIKI